MINIASSRRVEPVAKYGCFVSAIVFLSGIGNPQSTLAQDQSSDREVVSTVTGEDDIILNTSARSTSEDAISILVKMSAKDIVDVVDAVGVECSLRSGLLGGTGQDAGVVGSGNAVLVRQGKPIANFAELGDTVAIFDASTVDVSIEVAFTPELDNIPIEIWTHGYCQLYLYRVNLQIPREPRVCQAGTFQQPYSGGSADGLIACVWPGTDPATSHASFTRTGFESFGEEAETIGASNE